MKLQAGENNRTDYELLQQAAEWFAVLQSETVTEQEREDWSQWLDATPQHRQVWQRVERISHQFNDLPSVPSRAVLGDTGFTRRQALKAMLLFCAVGGSGWQVARQQHWGAQYRTEYGGIQQVNLDDGSRLWLNTASAIDVDYSPTLRRIVLLKGEVHIETVPGSGNLKRPLVVDTAIGRLTALGTGFSVRIVEDQILLSVFKGVVEIKPKRDAKATRVEAEQQVYFSIAHVNPVSSLNPSASSWINGVILADDMPLGDFIDELNRYYPGHLSCDPAAANLRLVGAYPLQDIERILKALEESLPVSVKRTLSWWINIERKES